MLVLDLLGTLSLHGDAGPVPAAAQQKRRLGLLAILALGGKQGLPRSRIESYLWPESTAARASHALDQAVYAVRHALGGDVILSIGQDLRLNPEFFLVDAWKFGDAIREKEWEAAARLYRGPLLDGFHFGDSRELEAWIDAERARMLLDYQSAIDRLADRAAETGDRPQEVTWRRRLARSDALATEPTRKLMLALAGIGDRAGAVKEARKYQELVRQELEMEPDAGIERLAVTLSQPSVAESSDSSAQSESAKITPIPANTTPTPPKTTPTPSNTTRSADSEMGASPPPAKSAEMVPRNRPSGLRFSTQRSRLAAFATFSLIPVLLIAVLAVKNGQVRNSPPALSGSTGPNGSTVPSSAARDEYLRGISAWGDRTKEGHDKAIAHFRRATELDPGYAEAYAGLAEAYVRIGYFGYRPGEAMFPKAKAAALRSMQLDSTLAPAHTALATELIWEHDFTGAESEYRKAISLDPSNATAHQWYGVLLMILGRVNEAVAQERRASDLEPLSLQIQNNYGAFLNISGEHLAALRHFEKTVGEEPDSAWVRRNPWVLANMARVYADNGHYPDAIRAINRAVEIVPGSPRAFHTMAVIYNGMGRRDLAREAYGRADKLNEQYAAYRGMVYADQGHADSAFLWFDRQEAWGIQPMLSLQSDRHIEPLRGDPRYRALIRRIGIPTRRP